MALLDIRGGRFLYEVFPHQFPEGQLTETEIVLWELYYGEKKDNAGKR